MSHLLKQHYGGWRPQKPNHQDFIFSVPDPGVKAPPYLDLLASLNQEIPLLNQAQQGSCTGHGSVGLVMFDQAKQGLPVVEPSPAMAYWNARSYEGTTDQDSGAEVRDAVKGIANYGVCPNSEFPYDDRVYNLQPSPQAYADATNQEALVYEAVRYPHINAAIASGFPVITGFTVYESFESDEVSRTGVVPIPGPGESVLGGHCVWLWGYNASRTNWTSPRGKVIPARTKAARNSWGDWGDGGDFYLPQWYWDNGQATDHWVIRRIGHK